MRRLLAAAATGITIGALAFAAPAQGVTATTTAATTATGYVPPAPTWGDCVDQLLKDFGAECAMVSVPLDYDRPKGEKIQLAVSRMRHTSPASEYQGVMLVNPGGPGGSGLIYSVLQGFVPDGAGLTYDWIGFDPRGVGASRPALTCDGSYFEDTPRTYVPRTRSIERAWRTKTANYAEDCEAAGGRLLDHLKTTDTIADMESIRAALGAKKINFYGFSYGTYIGEVYATLHPDRVRRMVLDGVIDPDRVWWQSNLDQDFAFEKTIGIYFDWIAKHDDVYGLGTSGGDVEDAYDEVLKALTSSPRAGGQFGATEWNDVFVVAAYGVFAWHEIATAFAAAVNDGSYAPVKALADAFQGPSGPGADNGYAMYLAVICTDAPWPDDWDTWREVNWRIHDKAPFLTWNNAWYNAPCRTWAGDVGEPVDVDGSDAPPILLVAETHDAATPFSGALATRRLFPESRLIEGVGGTTHSASLSGVECTDGAIAAYLATGELPDRRSGNRADLRCDPLPPPDVSSASAASGTSRSGAVLSPHVLALGQHLLGMTR